MAYESCDFCAVLSILDYSPEIAGLFSNLAFPNPMNFTEGVLPARCGTPQHGLSSNKMALITSDCGTTRSLSIKWP